MPVRKIPRNYNNITGLMATDKSDEMTGYESRLEYGCQKLLTYNDNVEKYEEQPVKIYYTDHVGKPRSYHPDILIHYRKDTPTTTGWKPLLAEVKYRSNLFKNWDELKPKIQAGRRYAKEEGLDFALLTDKEICTPYLHNAVFLLDFKNLPINQGHTDLVHTAISKVKKSSPDALLRSITNVPSDRAQLIPTLWRLIANRMIGIDLEKQLTMHSPIWAISLESMEEGDEHLHQVRGGRGRRIRWRALHYYQHSKPDRDTLQEH